MLITQRPAPRWVLPTTLAVLLVATAIRPSWVFLVPPALALGLPYTPRKNLVIAALATLPVTALSWVVWRAASAPVPEKALQVDGNTGPLQFVRSAASYGADNIRVNLDAVAESFRHLDTHPHAMFAVYAAVVLLVVSAVYRAWMLRRGRDQTSLRLDAFAVWGLGSVLAVLLLYYVENAGSFNRVVTPHVLLLALVFVALRRRLGIVMLLAVVQVGLWHWAEDDNYRTRYNSFLYLPELVQRFDADLKAAGVRFEPGAEPWCNTMLSTVYPMDLVYLDPGVGVSFYRAFKPLSDPPRSRYFLLDPSSPLANQLNLEPIGQTRHGTLYRNLDAKC
jgi:hypothetical protein